MEVEDHLLLVADTTSFPTPTSPFPDPDPSPPHGSPEVTEIVLEDEEEEEEEDEVGLSPNDHQPSQISVLTDEIRNKIIKQVEYYFSDENLPNDKFLLKYVTKDKDGYVPVGVIASFRKMKKLTTERSWIVTALKESSFLVLSSNGKRVRRLQPLPVAGAAKDAQSYLVVAENLPEDHSVENIQRIFGEAGKIKNVSINDPHDAKGSKKLTIAEKLLSNKLHAVVEYETIEDAEKAVTMLNNEQDWRFGMRVKLVKRVEKQTQKKKAWKEAETESHNNTNRASGLLPIPAVVHEDNHSDHLDGTHHEEEINNDQEHSSKEKNEHKGPNRRRGRGQKYRGANGHGHGTVSSSSIHVNEPSKPPPGPKMPDGTKGFTMGRGRPLPLN
ncbi:la-related protein 6A [Impatiens glandulifera]|uniref:la-related protein 6A n=1 Tax=Impatiens glandulifera TaxID=253017 RepID=UPI001FB17972|nr:la-related protein 6A [Impatiens glandulifera]